MLIEKILTSDEYVLVLVYIITALILGFIIGVLSNKLLLTKKE